MIYVMKIREASLGRGQKQKHCHHWDWSHAEGSGQGTGTVREINNIYPLDPPLDPRTISITSGPFDLLSRDSRQDKQGEIKHLATLKTSSSFFSRPLIKLGLDGNVSNKL